MIFLTAFEPFGGDTINASWEVATLLAARNPHITLVQIPVVRNVAEKVALEAFHALPTTPHCFIALGEATEKRARKPLAFRPTTPHCFIALGEAGPESVIRLEKVAVNEDDFRLPDNAGNTVRETKIRTDGPDHYISTVDVDTLAQKLAGTTPIPLQVSFSAGAFLCNHLAYQMLDAPLPCPFLFIHVPRWRPESVLPYTLAEMCETLDAVLSTIITITRNLEPGSTYEK